MPEIPEFQLIRQRTQDFETGQNHMKQKTLAEQLPLQGRQRPRPRMPPIMQMNYLRPMRNRQHLRPSHGGDL